MLLTTSLKSWLWVAYIQRKWMLFATVDGGWDVRSLTNFLDLCTSYFLVYFPPHHHTSTYYLPVIKSAIFNYTSYSSSTTFTHTGRWEWQSQLSHQTVDTKMWIRHSHCSSTSNWIHHWLEINCLPGKMEYPNNPLPHNISCEIKISVQR